jgi:hypothetical protein
MISGSWNGERSPESLGAFPIAFLDCEAGSEGRAAVGAIRREEVQQTIHRHPPNAFS